MRALSFAALIVGIVLIPTALGLAKLDHDRELSQVERMLVAETEEHGGALDNYFLRARSVVLLTANSPAFANVLAEPGSRAEKVRRQGRNIAEVTHHLRYLEQLYPSSIGEARFIAARGAGRAGRGARACGARKGARPRRPLDDRGADVVLPPHVRAPLRPGPPGRAV